MSESRFEALSPRELEVLTLAADGLKPKLIANRLSLSERTIYTHLSSATKKLGTGSVGEAIVVLARRDRRGPYAESDEQALQVVPQLPPLLELLVPEAAGRSINELGKGRRLFVIISRALIVALLMVAMASLVRDVGRILDLTR